MTLHNYHLLTSKQTVHQQFDPPRLGSKQFSPLFVDYVIIFIGWPQFFVTYSTLCQPQSHSASHHMSSLGPPTLCARCYWRFTLDMSGNPWLEPCPRGRWRSWPFRWMPLPTTRCDGTDHLGIDQKNEVHGWWFTMKFKSIWPVKIVFFTWTPWFFTSKTWCLTSRNGGFFSQTKVEIWSILMGMWTIESSSTKHIMRYNSTIPTFGKLGTKWGIHHIIVIPNISGDLSAVYQDLTDEISPGHQCLWEGLPMEEGHASTEPHEATRRVQIWCMAIYGA